MASNAKAFMVVSRSLTWPLNSFLASAVNRTAICFFLGSLGAVDVLSTVVLLASTVSKPFTLFFLLPNQFAFAMSIPFLSLLAF